MTLALRLLLLPVMVFCLFVVCAGALWQLLTNLEG